MPLYVSIDLSAVVTPGRAVSQLEGTRFKQTEQRVKRYVRAGAFAEAVAGGGLRVCRMTPVGREGDAHLIDRRWMTMADFPWCSEMDSEGLLVKHTTFVTHRVTVVCERGPTTGDDCVRVEWDYAAGTGGDADHAERVDWLLAKLGAPAPAAAGLTLKRLLRRHKHAPPPGSQDVDDGEGAEIWTEDGGLHEERAQGPRQDEAPGLCDSAGSPEAAYTDAPPR